jgi:Peptidase M66
VDRSNAGAGGHERCVTCVHGDAGATAGGDGGAGGDAGTEAGAAGAPAIEKNGVAIAEVSFWQTLRVPLEVRGSIVAANAPIISGKDGILRVYVAPDPKFQARALSAVLELGIDSDLTSFESKKVIARPSNDATFASTFNFPLESAQVTPGTSYSITVGDPTSGEVLDRFPKLEHSPLDARSASVANRLDVVVVPYVVQGLEPDVSAVTVAAFRTRLAAMYPVADVSITVHAPVTSSLEVGPERGWEALLDAVYALRATDAPAANVFYYGLFTPQKTFDEYCVTDCTVGYSIVAEPYDVDSRGSLGLGVFSDGSNRDAPDTMAHELGHALGREHAPCDVSNLDSGPFPYPGGKIGVWGFDAPHHALLDPGLYGDVMGYCSPDWISDYTYRALFERIALVNAEVETKALGTARAPSAYRRVILAADGSLRWGSRSTPSRTPRGPLRELTLLGNDGAVIGKISVVFRRFADAQGGFLLLPESALRAVSAIRIGSAKLALPIP